MNTIKISAVAICKNEEVDLPGFLSCLQPWVSEIVIVDDGSTDRTLEILDRAGEKVKVVHRTLDEEGGFSAQRNAGIEAATGEWLLHLDIDERITPELAEEIQNVVSDTTKNGFKYRRLNYFLHHPMRYGGWQFWNRPQFARKGRHHFINAIHEECVIEGGEDKIGQLDNPVHHFIDDGYVERVKKNMQYMQLSGKQILARGIKVSWYHLLLHPLYRSLQSYFLHQGWREGTRGFLFAIYIFSSTFNWWAFAWEKQNRISRESLEEKMARLWRERASKNN